MSFDESRIEKKRFIAAAVCPRCETMDTIYTCTFESQLWRACVNCDFNEAFREQDGAREELATRVNQPRLNEPTLPHETPLESVKIIEPKS